jgi:hypothetical protein
MQSPTGAGVSVGDGVRVRVGVGVEVGVEVGKRLQARIKGRTGRILSKSLKRNISDLLLGTSGFYRLSYSLDSPYGGLDLESLPAFSRYTSQGSAT